MTDRKPDWFQFIEDAFDWVLKGVVLSFWLWGLCVFALVFWGIWMVLIQGNFE